MKPKKRIRYGEANYKSMVLDKGYYVDKTGYIRLMEEYNNPVFLRPRRFGKSLWCTTLEYYYDINEADDFEQLFGHTDIGKNPTPLHNSFMILSEKFNMAQFFQKDFYPISFFYLGMLTKQDEQYMCLPNLNMRSIFVDYFNDIYKIDVSTMYAELMAGFITQPDIPTLFAGYWDLYISQLPEAIFQQVNENFYRTTFFELCRQHLSKYFTFEVERSYVTGRTDLEFIGKFHTQFAGLRYLLEFKYYSNAKWKKIRKELPGSKEGKKTKDKISLFQAPKKDMKQLKAYEKEWKKEHPQGEKKSFLVYCFGNQGFRVFPV